VNYAGIILMTDQEMLIKAVEEARSILAAYIALGPRNPHAAIHSLSGVLCQAGLSDAIKRLKSGYGLRVVK
jgi:hypothetical protein